MATRKWLPYFYYINPSFSFFKLHRLIKPISPPTFPRGVAIQCLYLQKIESICHCSQTWAKKIINFITSCAIY